MSIARAALLGGYALLRTADPGLDVSYRLVLCQCVSLQCIHIVSLRHDLKEMLTAYKILFLGWLCAVAYLHFWGWLVAGILVVTPVPPLASSSQAASGLRFPL